MITVNKFIWANLNLVPLIVILVCIISIICFYNYDLRRKLIKSLGNIKLRSDLWNNLSFLRLKFKILTLLFAFIFLAIVLIRPQENIQNKDDIFEARDILIALDISRSMLAQDVKPNRINLAKDKIKKIIQNLSADRVGLIVFSGSAFIQTPITKDIDTFLLLLDGVDTETISSGTTNIASAIDKAIEQFAKIDSQQKTLLLITDGEDFVGNGQFLQDKIKQHNLTLIILAIGTTQGAPIPIYNEKNKLQGYQKDKDNNIVISKLNPEFLQNLAKHSSGFYTLVSQDESDVYKILNFLKKIDVKRKTEEISKIRQERYHFFEFLGFLSLLMHWLL